MIDAFKFNKIKSKDIDKESINDGQFLCTVDTQKLYFDYNGKRISFSDIILVENKDELKKIPYLIPNKFYYIKDPNDPTMLFYNGTKLIGGSNKYIHPVYKIMEGSYRKVTVNKYGHVIEASNDILKIDEGGTGCKNADQIKALLNIPDNCNNEVSNLKKEVEILKNTIENLTNQINNIKLSYIDNEFYMSTEDKESES